MVNRKSRLAELGLLEIWILRKVAKQLLRKRNVVSFGETTLLVENRNDAQLIFNQRQDRLIVGKLNVGPVNLLARVLGLLELENVLIKLLLQLLVCPVDAKLE